MNVIRATLSHLSALTPLFDRYRVFYQQPSDPIGARSFLSAKTRNSTTMLCRCSSRRPLSFLIEPQSI